MGESGDKGVDGENEGEGVGADERVGGWLMDVKVVLGSSARLV